MHDYFVAGSLGVVGVYMLLLNLWFRHKHGNGRKFTLWDFLEPAFYAFMGLGIWLDHSLASSQIAHSTLTIVFFVLGAAYLFAFTRHMQHEAREHRDTGGTEI